MRITVDNFQQTAMQQKNENKRIQLKESGVSVAGAWRRNNPTANRQAIEAFSQALRAKYGNDICNMSSIRGILVGRHAAGKALTARMVLDMVKLAGEEFKRVNAHNASEVEEFLSGRDAEGKAQNQNLTRAVAGFCEQNKIPPEHQAEVQSRVKAFLQAKAARNGFSPAILTLDSLMKEVENGSGKYTGPATPSLALVLGKEGRHFPGTVEDKLRLVDLGVSVEGNALPRAIWELGNMRTNQPQGELTQETVWKALFNENSLPQEVLSGAKTFAAALEGKHAADCQAMAEGFGFKHASFIESQISLMPWSTIAAMQQRSGKTTLTLENMPGASLLLPKGDKFLQSLKTDLVRASAPGVKPPEVTFTFLDGRKETIQLGPDTNFVFINKEDEEAYRGGTDNSLAQRLQENCRGITGSEKQSAGAMLCLTQAPLILLKKASELNGALLDKNTPISVSLRPGPGGVRAEFSSPPGVEGTAGRFSLIIDIDNDGTMAIREFEVTPPGFFKEQKIDAQRARMDDAQQQAVPFLAMDDSPRGLMTAMRQRLTLVSNPPLTEKSLAPIHAKIVVSILNAARASGSNLSPDQIRGIRDTVLDEQFASFTEAAGKIPLHQRDALIHASLATGVFPKPGLVPVIGQMAGEVKKVLGDLSATTDAGEARGLLSELQRVMTEVTMAPEYRVPGFGMDEFLPAQELAMRMGLMAFIGREDPDAALRGLTRQGGPFRDMLHGLAHDSDENFTNTAHAYNWFRTALEGIVSETTMDRLDMNNIRERDLSVARQREILDQAIVARGAGVALPVLNVMNKALLENMRDIKAKTLSDIRELLLNGPSGGIRDSDRLSDEFVKDYPREGAFVNGRFHKPDTTNTSLADFKNLFPEPYVAEKLCNLMGQTVNSPFLKAIFFNPTLEGKIGQKQYGEFFSQTMGYSELSWSHNESRSRRIDTVNAQQGHYRVSAYYCMTSNDDQYGVERMMYELTMDVDLGPPGANPRPEPRVRDMQIDYLIRGREVVPGEE